MHIYKCDIFQAEADSNDLTNTVYFTASYIKDGWLKFRGFHLDTSNEHLEMWCNANTFQNARVYKVKIQDTIA